MSSFNQQLFHYLTELENYKYAKEIEVLIPEIDKQLRTDFWTNSVYGKLQKLQKNKNSNNFELELREDGTYSQIRIFKPHWKELCICYEAKGSFGDIYEKIYYAIQMNKKRYNMVNVAEIVNQENDKLNNISTEDSRWLCWKHITF